MKMRFGLAVLAYLVPTFALGFVWHFMLFESYYEHLAIYRSRLDSFTQGSEPCSRGASRRLPSQQRTE